MGLWHTGRKPNTDVAMGQNGISLPLNHIAFLFAELASTAHFAPPPHSKGAKSLLCGRHGRSAKAILFLFSAWVAVTTAGRRRLGEGDRILKIERFIFLFLDIFAPTTLRARDSNRGSVEGKAELKSLG